MEQKTFPAKASELDNVLALLEGECEKMEVPMAAQMQLSVAVEELFVNVADYGYGVTEGTGDSIIPVSQTDDNNTCTVTVGQDGDFIFVRLEDSGVPFDPFAKADPDVTASAMDRDIGGLGIYLVKKTMDECSYVRDGDKNIVVIRKKIK